MLVTVHLKRKLFSINKPGLVFPLKSFCKISENYGCLCVSVCVCVFKREINCMNAYNCTFKMKTSFIDKSGCIPSLKRHGISETVCNHTYSNKWLKLTKWL